MKNQSKKTGKMTIDKLAIMVAKGFESVEKRMTTKDDLKNLETRINGKLEGIDKRIDDFVVTRVKLEDHNKLKLRVDVIEKNLR